MTSSMVDLPAWLLPGVIVDGKYEIVRVLGHGGMGVVCEARHTTLGERVALKAMLAAPSRSPDAMARFLREARAAFAVRNEHVARVLDAGLAPSGDPYLVMELLEGTDLARLVRDRGPLPIAEAVEYIAQACEALSAAHGMGIVHRDVKPANIFLARRPDGAPLVKVLDFGIAKADEPSGQGLTETSTGMGTLPYMSPEQVKAARDVDARADIYSLGATLHELLTARRLIDAPSGAELIVQILHGEPTSVRMHRPEVPPALEAVITRATRKAREERFPTADIFASAARAALAPGASGAVGSPGPHVDSAAQRGVSASALASTSGPLPYTPTSAPLGPSVGSPPLGSPPLGSPPLGSPPPGMPPPGMAPPFGPAAYGPPQYAPANYSSHHAAGLYRGSPYANPYGQRHGLARPSRSGGTALTAVGSVFTVGGVLTFIVTAAGGVNSSEIGTAIAIGVAACAVGGPLLATGILRVNR